MSFLVLHSPCAKIFVCFNKIIKMLRIALSLVIFSLISIVKNPYLLKQKSINDYIYSNVWCTSKWKMKTCHFHNLYYDHDYGFIFVLTDDSSISGLDSYRDLMNLKLSPIDDHLLMNMQLTMVLHWEIPGRSIKKMTGDYFMIYRFKPDNFLHVIHDDLIPLYTTFKEICLGNLTFCSTKYQLLFADPHEGSPFIQWYRALSSREPLSVKELTDDFTFCFSSVTLGVANTSFFQYGFKKPQGPVKTGLIGNDIREFRNYFFKHFGVGTPLTKTCCAVTVVSRSINRKIMNEEYVFEAISSAMGDSKSRGNILYTIDMARNTTRDIFKAIVSSDVLVAVHGAETILSLFLTDQSIFIELFPFGIVKENVSPIASLSNIPDVHFIYLSWTNVREDNSIGHPEYPSQFGGIDGLSDDVIQSIYDTKIVPAVVCCNNPYYLFRMYQDTIVDESFHQVASTAVNKLNFRKSKLDTRTTTQWFFPGPVEDLRCIFYPHLVFVTWMVPFNLINSTAVYNVSVLGGTNHYNILTRETELYLKFSHGDVEKVEVWVSCHVNERSSIDSYCQCDIYDL